MLISILAGPRFIAFLRRKEYGQTIREEGPEHHVTKQGTPIMGGLLVLGAGTAAYRAVASSRGRGTGCSSSSSPGRRTGSISPTVSTVLPPAPESSRSSPTAPST